MCGHGDIPACLSCVMVLSCVYPICMLTGVLVLCAVCSNSMHPEALGKICKPPNASGLANYSCAHAHTHAQAEDGAVLSGGGSSGGEEEHHAQQQPQGQRDGSSSRGESKEQQQPPHAVPAQGPAGWGPEVGMGEAPWRKQKPVGMGGGPMGNMEGPSPASGGGGPWAGPGGVLPPAGLPSQGPLSGPCGMMLGAPANQGL
eukprot:scaffold315703_cov22-Tisochrysis_lutea.AAC.2